MQIARLLTVYVQSPPVVPRDKKTLGDIEGFPDDQPSRRAT
jgi:hypothetical protein